MKRTSRVKKDRSNTPRSVNPFIAEALSRERAKADFKTEMELIGAKLLELRTGKGLAPEAVAKKLGISKRRLSEIECGTYVHFGVPLFYALCEYYGVSPTKLLSVIPKTAVVDLKH
jgi:hypothetical protein